MRKAIFTAVMGMLAVVSVACSGGPGATTVTIMHASYARRYGNLHDLKMASDAIVWGRISAVEGVFPVNDSGLFTNYRLSVIKVVHDPNHLITGASVSLSQTGGVLGNHTAKNEDEPPYEVGEDALLFLVYGSKSGLYSTVSGPNGRFQVRNGLVFPINADAVQLSQQYTPQSFAAAVQQS